MWLTPLIGSLQAKLGGLTVCLACDYDLAQSHSERADVGITFVEPADPDLIVARLGTLHYRCYGSDEYFRGRAIPTRPEELRDHAFIEQSAPGLNPQLREYLVGKARGESFVRLRTTSGVAMY